MPQTRVERDDFVRRQREQSALKTRTAAGQFVAKNIDDMIEYDDVTGCWLWKGYRNAYGYGRLTYKGKQRYAHRHVYGLLVRELFPIEELDHLCQHPPCVNPRHMVPTDSSENAKRVRQRSGVQCWYCAENLEDRDVCTRCGADRREVLGGQDERNATTC